MLLVGVGTAISQQAVGIDAIQYYLIDVLEESGVESEKGRLGILILLGVLKLMFILVGGKLFDRRGRKPLFYASLLGTCFALGGFLMCDCSLISFCLASRNDCCPLPYQLDFFGRQRQGKWLRRIWASVVSIFLQYRYGPWSLVDSIGGLCNEHSREGYECCNVFQPYDGHSDVIHFFIISKPYWMARLLSYVGGYLCDDRCFLLFPPP